MQVMAFTTEHTQSSGEASATVQLRNVLRVPVEIAGFQYAGGKLIQAEACLEQRDRVTLDERTQSVYLAPTRAKQSMARDEYVTFKCQLSRRGRVGESIDGCTPDRWSGVWKKRR